MVSALRLFLLVLPLLIVSPSASRGDLPGALALLDQDHLVALEGATGLRVYDLTTPTAPVVCGELDLIAVTRGLDTSDGLVCVATSEFDAIAADLLVVDATDPCAPQVVGSFNGPGPSSDVTVHGATVCLASQDAGVNIVSIADPGAPSLVASWQESVYPDINFPFQVDLQFPRLHVGSFTGGSFGAAFVVDVGDPSSPVTVGSLSFPYGVFPRGLAAFGDVATLFESGHGLIYLRHDFALSSVPDAIPGAATARISRIWPNPFNPAAKIAFEVDRPATMTLGVYDLHGRLVRILLSGAALPAGRHQAVWDGRDHHGRAAASGTYVFRLEGAGCPVTRSAVLLK